MRGEVCLRVNISSMPHPDPGVATNLIGTMSVEVRHGEIAAIVGRSGIGKTTLLRVIAGLDRRYRGEVTLDGAAVTRPSRAIQIVYQDYRLLPWMTVRENIAFSLPSRDARQRDVDRWIDRLGLRHRSNAWPGHLSGGEQARAALARIFVAPPSVLLLDEPFHNLDVVAQHALQDEVLALVSDKQVATLLVSHDILDAVYLADCVHVLSTSPMQVARTVPIPLSRPRRRDDPRLAAVVTQVTAALRTAAGVGSAAADRP